MRTFYCKDIDITNWLLFHTTDTFNKKKTKVSLDEYYYMRWNTYRDKPSAPLIATINITNSCNLRCEHCSRKNSSSGKEISIDQVSFLVKKLKDEKVKTLVLTGGEPLLHSEILTILDIIKESGFNLKLLTNLNIDYSELSKKLDKLNENEDQLQISIDGLGADYEAIRKGGDFSKLSNNLELLQTYRVYYTVNMVVTKHNYHTMYDVLRFSEQNGASGIRFTPFFGDPNSRLQVDLKEIMSEFCELLDLYMKNGNSVPILSDPVGLVYPMLSVNNKPKSFIRHQPFVDK